MNSEKQVKQIAQELLDILQREKLVLDWRKRPQARASVKVAIEEKLDELPPIYDEKTYYQVCGLTYQHVYDKYWGPDQSVYRA